MNIARLFGFFALLAAPLFCQAQSIPIQSLPPASPLSQSDLAIVGQQNVLRRTTIGNFVKAGTTSPAVSNNVALTALSTANASMVTRLGVATPGDAPPIVFVASGSACTLNSGQGDVGSQVPSADGKCWVAQYQGPADVREWGAVSNATGSISSGDSLAAFTAAINYFSYSGGTTTSGGVVTVPAGTYCVSNSIVMTGKHGLTITGQGRLATSISTCGGNYPLFLIASGVTTPTNAPRVTNFNLICGGETNTSSNGVQWAYVNNGTIDHNDFFSCYHAIHVVGHFLTYIDSNNITGNGSQQNAVCLYAGFPTDSGDTYADNALIVTNNLCQFASTYGARLVDANGSLFLNNQWMGVTGTGSGTYSGTGVYGCDQPSATYPSGYTAACEFMFFQQDQTDTTAGRGWLFVLGSGGQMGPEISLDHVWAGSSHTASFDIEGPATNFLITNLEINNGTPNAGDIGLKLNNVSTSIFSGRISNYNTNNNGSQAVLLSGTTSGNTVKVTTSTGNPVAGTYNGIEETGTYSGNLLEAGVADCSSTIGLLFGGAATGITYSSSANICSYHVEGMEVFVQLGFDLTSKGTATGAATLTGLPIVAGPANFSGYGAVNACFGGDGTGSHLMAGLTAAPIISQTRPAMTTVNLYQQAATDIAALTNSNFTNSSALNCALHYQKQ